MNRTVRHYIIRIGIICIFAAAIVLIANAVRPTWAESTEQRADAEILQDYDLTLWYYDDSLTPYVKQLQEDYFRAQGKRVGCEKVTVVSFFENMNRLNVSGKDMPDLYITDSMHLEQAYLGATAKENAFPELYSLKNYAVQALNAVMYQGKMVAYPLAFDMEYFVYNKDYMEKAPASFENIGVLSEQFVKKADSTVDMVFLSDVSDLLCNYHFIGSSMDMGGKNRDDDSSLYLNDEKLVASLTAYQTFAGQVNINMNTTTYDLVENSFVFGRSMSAVLKCRSLSALNQEKTNYEIISMPAVNASISSQALSETWCVCVNPGSNNTEAAENLAKYMTYDRTEDIYDQTGYMSCKRMSYTEPGFDTVYQLYDATVSLPKFIETEELWKDMQRMMNAVWNGTDPTSAYVTFRASLDFQLESRKK